MKKIGVSLILLVLLLSSIVGVYAAEDEDNSSSLKEKVSGIVNKTKITGAIKSAPSKIDKYAEIVGGNILKFQEFFMGALAFLSFGVFREGGQLAFAQFLFMVLVFMVVHGTAGFIFKKYNILIASIITLLAFIAIDAESIQVILGNYEAMGIAITVVLPLLIILAFTFRIYQRAYEGEKGSPFYAELFNLVFLIFCGNFFIRYSYSEEGAIAIMRYISGWVLIGLGIGQLLLYKMLARWIGQAAKDAYKAKKEIRKARQEIVDKKLERDSTLG